MLSKPNRSVDRFDVNIDEALDLSLLTLADIARNFINQETTP